MTDIIIKMPISKLDDWIEATPLCSHVYTVYIDGIIMKRGSAITVIKSIGRAYHFEPVIGISKYVRYDTPVRVVVNREHVQKLHGFIEALLE